MATEKVSLTLDSNVLKQARRRAGRRGLSSFVDDALRVKLQHERLGEWLDEMDSKYGPVPEPVKREVEREWRARGKQRKARRLHA
jgi:hypothetical protein